MRKPKFNKKAPKHWLRFFSAKSDGAFKRAHPIGYWVLVIVGIIAFVLPMILYNIIVIDLWDAPNSAWIVLGLLGCLVMGVGLFNIVAAWIGQYLGHAVTWITLLGGAVLVGASILLMFNRKLYEMIDQEMLGFCVATVMFLLILLIPYVGFRYAIDFWLTHTKKFRRRDMNQMKKGKRNYWWYEEIHRNHGMGMLYHLNKTFTISYLLALMMTIVFGFFRVMSIPICVLSMIAYLSMTVMKVFTNVQNNIEEHGKIFVLLKKNSMGKVDSIWFDLLSVALILVIAYAHLIVTFNLWGISLPHL